MNTPDNPRKSEAKRLDPKVFQMAANLFGYQPKPKEDTPRLPIAIELPKDVVCAVYPAITADAFALTMSAYRQHIAAYNFMTDEENRANDRDNDKKTATLKNNPPTGILAEYARIFSLKNKSLSPREWNQAVDEAEKQHDVLILKKKVQTVKYATEIVFQNLLHLYNSQLMKRNTEYMRLGVQTVQPIQEMLINSYMVTQLKRDEVKSLDLCRRTVRNHRQRLEECGVFVNYNFRGRQRAVGMHINASILHVLDMKSSKIVRAENQHVTSVTGKVLPDNNENTRTYIKNKYEIKENVKNSSLDKEFPPVTPFILNFTRTPDAKLKLNQGAAAAENFKTFQQNAPKSPQKPNSPSEKLQELILHPQELAVKLANHEFDNYTPIDIRLIYDEAFKGTLTNEEFRELVLQDFFKNSAKLYRKSTAYAGSWKTAINLYYSHKFKSFTGGAFNKSVIVDDIQDLRWQLEHARKWFIKHQFNPLFPSQYFDMTRTTAKEVGFEYTKKALGKHKIYLSKREDRTKKAEKAAQLRKETINNAKKCSVAVKKFFKNKMSLVELMDYVENNLPKEFREKLPQIIENESLNLNK